MKEKHKYNSLKEQLVAEEFMWSPNQHIQLPMLPFELNKMNLLEREMFSNYNILIIPSFLVNGGMASYEPEHMFAMRPKKKDAHRFKPDFEIENGNFASLDERLKNSGFFAHVIENDVIDRGFAPHIVDMVDNKFGEHYLIIPAQIARIGEKDQFLRKSYIIYHTGKRDKIPYGTFYRNKSDGGASQFRYYYDK